MTITDLTPEPYAGPGVGVTDTCGMCHRQFDLMHDPAQYPTVYVEGTDTWDLICESCQDEICGKSPDRPHDAATRAAHMTHLARLGWSGMCPAPRSQASEALRASLAAAGWAAESPLALDPEAEQIARTERQD